MARLRAFGRILLRVSLLACHKPNQRVLLVPTFVGNVPASRTVSTSIFSVTLIKRKVLPHVTTDVRRRVTLSSPFSVVALSLKWLARSVRCLVIRGPAGMTVLCKQLKQAPAWVLSRAVSRVTLTVLLRPCRTPNRSDVELVLLGRTQVAVTSETAITTSGRFSVWTTRTRPNRGLVKLGPSIFDEKSVRLNRLKFRAYSYPGETHPTSPGISGTRNSRGMFTYTTILLTRRVPQPRTRVRHSGSRQTELHSFIFTFRSETSDRLKPWPCRTFRPTSGPGPDIRMTIKATRSIRVTSFRAMTRSDLS